MIPNNRQPQYKPVYYLQRPQSPKTNLTHVQSAKNLSVAMSSGANLSGYCGYPFHKPKEQLTQQSPIENNPTNLTDKFQKMQLQMRLISKENASLREENQIIRKQLFKLKRTNGAQNVRSSQKYPSHSPESFVDLRGTIKKESSQIKDLKIKLDMISKQCKMYEEIIDKMDERIKKLTYDNQKKTSQLDEMQAQLSKIDQLKEKANSIMRLYNDLESSFNNDQLEWMKWKQGWLSEKEFYLHRIKELENIMEKSFQ